MEYLGLVISEGTVRMDEVKVNAISEWLAPKNLHKLRGFLGFANFYRCFIKDFAKTAHPLNNMTKKDTPWHWGPEQREAFKMLKDTFISEPIPVTWEPVDTSGYATGGVISQKLPDGLWHPITYQSQTMADAERNYDIHN